MSDGTERYFQYSYKCDKQHKLLSTFDRETVLRELAEDTFKFGCSECSTRWKPNEEEQSELAAAAKK